MFTDAHLLNRYIEEHSSDAFAAIVSRHLDGVYSAALRRVGGDTHLAEDVSQHVFIALARQAKTLRTHPALVAWLHRTTRNEAANTVRRERRRKNREEQAANMNEMIKSDGEALAANWSQLAPLLDNAIDELKETDRTALLLRFIDRRSFSEIGATLQLTDDAARMRVDRALEKLRLQLTRRGITSSSAALSLVLTTHAVTAAPASLSPAILTTATITIPAAAGITSAVLAFMSTTQTTLTLATLACILSVVTATYQTAAARSAEAALNIDKRNIAALRAELTALEQKIQTAELASTPVPTAPPSPNIAANDSSTPDPVAEGEAFMARHPEVKQALIERKRASIIREWIPFFRAQNFTQDQIDRFVDILLDQKSWYDRQGRIGEKPLLLSTGRVSKKEIDERVRNLLGDELYEKRSAFALTIPTRRRATELASILAFSETPLTAVQADQITAIIQENRVTKSDQKKSEFDWDTIAAKAQHVLSSPQISALENLRASDELNHAFNHTSNAAASSSLKTDVNTP